MSKLMISTDWHIGARGGSTIFRDYFTWYFKEKFFPYMKENKITTLLMLGDFFDNRNHLSLSDIAFVNEVFLPLLESHKCTMYIIAGNHDLAFKNTNAVTSLSIMQHSKYVHILKDKVEEFEFDGSRFVFVPWINGNNYDEFMTSLNNVQNKENTVVLCHAEFNSFLMYKNSSRCESGIEPSLFKEFKAVWSGHFHHPSKIGNVEYLGSMFHLNWQDHNDKRGFWVYDTDTQEKAHIENEHSLFTEILYEDDHGLTDDQISEYCEHQFVKIVINKEYDKVKFMDFFSKVNSAKPIDVQVQNNYAIMSAKENTKTDEAESDVKDKSIDAYINTYVMKTVSEDKRASIMSKFNDVKAKASDMMVKGE